MRTSLLLRPILSKLVNRGVHSASSVSCCSPHPTASGNHKSFGWAWKWRSRFSRHGEHGVPHYLHLVETVLSNLLQQQLCSGGSTPVLRKNTPSAAQPGSREDCCSRSLHVSWSLGYGTARIQRTQTIPSGDRHSDNGSRVHASACKREAAALNRDGQKAAPSGVWDTSDEIATAEAPTLIRICLNSPARNGKRTDAGRCFESSQPSRRSERHSHNPPTTATKKSVMLSLQLRVLDFGLLQDRDVGVGILPEREKISVCRLGFSRGRSRVMWVPALTSMTESKRQKRCELRTKQCA
jgi:hypothetical protein